jgi:hypothetical protein
VVVVVVEVVLPIPVTLMQMLVVAAVLEEFLRFILPLVYQPLFLW